MDIVKPTDKTVDSLVKLELAAGVPVAMHRRLCNDSILPVPYHRPPHNQLRRTEQGRDRP